MEDSISELSARKYKPVKPEQTEKIYIYQEVDVTNLKSSCLILVQLAYSLPALCQVPILSDFLTGLLYCSVFLYSGCSTAG